MFKTLLLVLATILIEVTEARNTTHFEELITEFEPRRIILECTAALEDLTQQFLYHANDTLDLSDTRNIDESINAINTMEWSCS